MGQILDRAGHLIAAYLQKPASGYQPAAPADPDALRNAIKPGDVLLIEGHNRISGIIKYLTQSTWSHASLCVGEIAGRRIGQRRTLQHDRVQCGRRRHWRPAVEIFPIPYPHLPAGRADRHRLPQRLRLRHRADRAAIRSEELDRPRALSGAAAGAAALAAADDRARLRRSDPAHLFVADRAGLRQRRLPDLCRASSASAANRRGRRFSTFATLRSIPRAISIFPPISP